jgi:serine/threonine protein kinase
MAACLTLAELQKFVTAKLAPERGSEVQAHLDICASCRQALRVLTTAGGRTDGTRLDDTRTEGTRIASSRIDAARIDAARTEGTCIDSIRSDAACGDAARTDGTIVRSGPPAKVEWPRHFPRSLGPFTLLRELGAGGMGVVYLAEQPGLKRLVALKVIRHGINATAEEVGRFCTEAQAVARLQHPNIVQVFEVGEADGMPYLVLEYVAGGSLAQHLDGKPQPVRICAKLVEMMARAVQAAHTNGIIHRDLKPGNILLQPADHRTMVPGMAVTQVEPSQPVADLADALPKVADFGLAKCVEGDASQPSRNSATITGDWVGTPSYMAPEQAATPRQPIGPAADVYALGAILYEMLTGRPPFLAESALETVMQVLHKEPVPVRSLQPTVPRDLETICHKCLEKSQTRRYGSALELADDLLRFLRGETIRARPAGVVEKALRWVRRYPAAAGLLAAGLLGPVVAFGVLSMLSTQLVRSNALDSAAQQAELLEEANKAYSANLRRVEKAGFPLNRSAPPTPGTVPLSIPATFMHEVGEQIHQTGKTGVKVRQYSDYPFAGRTDGGPRDDFERRALEHLRKTEGKESFHEFTEMDGQRVVRYAQGRPMQQGCVECHNTHPNSTRKDWKVGDVRGVLEIIRPLDKDEARVSDALWLALLLSAVVSALLVGGGVLLMWVGRRAARS